MKTFVIVAITVGAALVLVTVWLWLTSIVDSFRDTGERRWHVIQEIGDFVEEEYQALWLDLTDGEAVWRTVPQTETILRRIRNYPPPNPPAPPPRRGAPI